jgi:hypothetical protein
VAVLALGQGAPAAALSLSATQQGWWACCSPLDHFRYSTFVGNNGGGDEYRNYFVFDLAGIDGVIAAATLSIYNPAADGVSGNGFYSPDGSETYTLFDYDLPIPWVTETGDAGYYAWLELGNGAPWGSVTITAADNGHWVDIPLNATAVAYLNYWLGYPIVLGGALTTIESPTDYEWAFGYSGEIGLLHLTVPEPGLLPLLAAFAPRLARRVRASRRS